MLHPLGALGALRGRLREDGEELLGGRGGDVQIASEGFSQGDRGRKAVVQGPRGGVVAGGVGVVAASIGQTLCSTAAIFHGLLRANLHQIGSVCSRGRWDRLLAGQAFDEGADESGLVLGIDGEVISGQVVGGGAVVLVGLLHRLVEVRLEGDANRLPEICLHYVCRFGVHFMEELPLEQFVVHYLFVVAQLAQR